MLESDVVSVTEDLVDRNYQKFLKGSRQIGRSAKKLWDDKILQETG